MKKILVLLMLAMPFAAHAEDHHAHGAPAAAEDKVHDGGIVHVGVDGMVCDFCAQSLIKVFKENPAIEDVDISLEKKLMTLYLKKGTTVDDKFINDKVEWGGYKVSKIHRMEKAE